MSAVSAVVRPRAHARHAKPSKAAPALVAGGLTMTFAVTDGLALAGSASAGGSMAQFERLAQCESGGNWSINTGNGYYGGLQFNLGTWRGLGFGGYPQQASKATQIAAGQKLQAQRGWSPWPSCSRQLGLSGDGGNSSDGGSDSTAAATSAQAAQAPRVTSADRREAANRASRSRTATKAAQLAAAKARTARVSAIRALAPTEAPRFDGHVLTVQDAGTYRIAVKHWQRRMAARGWSITVDGHFGPQSAAVARSFAADKKSVAGPGTVDGPLWALAWTAPVTV